jgi:hypothetical protein
MAIWKRQSGSTIELKDTEEMEEFGCKIGWIKEGEEKPSYSENQSSPHRVDDLQYMEDKDEIADYVLEKTGQILDKRGSLEKVKEKARDILDGNSE